MFYIFYYHNITRNVIINVINSNIIKLTPYFKSVNILKRLGINKNVFKAINLDRVHLLGHTLYCSNCLSSEKQWLVFADYRSRAA